MSARQSLVLFQVVVPYSTGDQRFAHVVRLVQWVGGDKVFLTGPSAAPTQRLACRNDWRPLLQKILLIRNKSKHHTEEGHTLMKLAHRTTSMGQRR